MAIELDYGAGVRRLTTSDSSSPPPSEGTLRACREIIDAASALSLDLEYLAGAADPEGKEHAVDDARMSIERIVKLAERVRKTPNRRPLAEGQQR